jgi:PTH1 family peptidyl-tRNA hydrolase
VDAIHRRHNFGPWRNRFQAETAEGTLANRKVLLMKPTTYMNESGRAVAEAARFFKVPPQDIVVLHDELDLPPGKTRMKVGGGAGGNNGVRSLNAHIGDGYRRLRIGIGHPGRKELVHVYVLHDFAKADAAWLEPLLAAIADNAALLADGRDATLANRLHRALEPEEPQAKKPSTANDKSAAAESVSQPVESKVQATSASRSDAASTSEGPLAGALKKLFGTRQS